MTSDCWHELLLEPLFEEATSHPSIFAGSILHRKGGLDVLEAARGLELTNCNLPGASASENHSSYRQRLDLFYHFVLLVILEPQCSVRQECSVRQDSVSESCIICIENLVRRITLILNELT